MTVAARGTSHDVVTAPLRAMPDSERQELLERMRQVDSESLSTILKNLANMRARREPEVHLFAIGDDGLDRRYGRWSLCSRVWAPHFDVTNRPGAGILQPKDCVECADYVLTYDTAVLEGSNVRY